MKVCRKFEFDQNNWPNFIIQFCAVAKHISRVRWEFWVERVRTPRYWAFYANTASTLKCTQNCITERELCKHLLRNASLDNPTGTHSIFALSFSIASCVAIEMRRQREDHLIMDAVFWEPMSVWVVQCPFFLMFKLESQNGKLGNKNDTTMYKIKTLTMY